MYSSSEDLFWYIATFALGLVPFAIVGLICIALVLYQRNFQRDIERERNNTHLLVGRERNQMFLDSATAKQGALDDKKELLVNAKVLQEIKSLAERLEASESGRQKLVDELEALKSQQQPTSKTVVVVADQDDSRFMDPAESADSEVAAGFQIEPDDLATYDEQPNGHVS